jgi:hypothetical protein
LASFSPAWRLFLLTFSSFANKIRPVCYKGCTKYFLYCKVCTKYFPVLLRTTKLAERIFQYYLLCTTKLGQSTTQYYSVRLHKVLCPTKFAQSTLYYKACTMYFPVLLRTTYTEYFPVRCTTKLAHNVSQYYFLLQSLKRAVLQSLHKVLPTLHYKVAESNCILHINYFPVLLVLQSMQRELSCCACEPFARIQLNLMLCLRNVPRDKKTRKKT